MGAVRSLAVAALLIVSLPARADTVVDWRPFVADASRRFGVPSLWIERVMQAESGGHRMLSGAPIVSSKGAMGLMQLMPDSWAEMRALLGLGNDPFDPHDNILAGTAYLRLLYDRFGYPGLFAAYNAGPSRYRDYLAGRLRLPGETRLYVESVAGGGRIAPRTRPERHGGGLFVARSGDGNIPPAPPHAAPAGLFAIREDR